MLIEEEDKKEITKAGNKLNNNFFCGEKSLLPVKI